MRVYRCPKATNEVEALSVKYRSAGTSVEQFERLLSASQTHGHQQIPDLKLVRFGRSASIWKSRVLCPELGGKSSGLRYVYERLTIDGEEYIVGLTVYVHQSGIKESAVVKRIRERFASFEPTTEGIHKLERAETE